MEFCTSCRAKQSPGNLCNDIVFLQFWAHFAISRNFRSATLLRKSVSVQQGTPLETWSLGWQFLGHLWGDLGPGSTYYMLVSMRPMSILWIQPLTQHTIHFQEFFWPLRLCKCTAEVPHMPQESWKHPNSPTIFPNYQDLLQGSRSFRQFPVFSSWTGLHQLWSRAIEVYCELPRLLTRPVHALAAGRASHDADAGRDWHSHFPQVWSGNLDFDEGSAIWADVNKLNIWKTNLLCMFWCLRNLLDVGKGIRFTELFSSKFNAVIIERYPEMTKFRLKTTRVRVALSLYELCKKRNTKNVREAISHCSVFVLIAARSVLSTYSMI